MMRKRKKKYFEGKTSGFSKTNNYELIVAHNIRKKRKKKKQLKYVAQEFGLFFTHKDIEYFSSFSV